MVEFAEPIRLVIWDLDETLWHGTLEEGPVTLPPEHAEIVQSLARRGIVSAVCSRNDHATAKARLEQCGLWEWLVFSRIAYTFKSGLVAEIVEQIGLRPETVLFIDDNPFNRADVAERMPGINVADISIIPELLDHPQLRGKADEQLTRLARYRVLDTRQAEYSAAPDRTAFLRDCEITVSIHYDVENQFERIHELVNRTNQLNFTKLRWPEEVQAARTEYFGTARKTYATHAGYVKVRDRYGYYGICGFFETRRKAGGVSLLHFLFSCRVLNMGVEQFVYQHLGFPRLKKGATAVTELSRSHVVDWIALSADAERESVAEPTKTRPTLCTRGPCELVQSAHYLRSQFTTIEEFHYPRGGWQIMRPLLRNIVLKDEFEQRGISSCADLGLRPDFAGIDFSALGSSFFEGVADVCVWSFSMQSLETLYRHRATELLIPLAIRGDNLEDVTKLDFSSLSEAQNTSEPDFRAVHELFDCAAFADQRQFAADLRVLRQKLQALGKPFIVIESFDDITKIDKPRFRSHANFNKLVRDGLAGLDNVYYIRFSDCVSDVDDQLIGNHFVRDVYMRLASRMQDLILAIVETGQGGKANGALDLVHTQ